MVMGAVMLVNPGSAAAAPQPVAEATVTGFVTDENTTSGIEGAEVTLSGAAYRQTETVENGIYTFTNVPAGDYSIEVWADGYLREFYNNQFTYADRTTVLTETDLIVVAGHRNDVERVSKSG